ncbi:MAG: glycoside hydrolase family protein [Vallitalea sp.]|jgi:hypothetical protein|nr:glycoside hydrolase family protein [Vallitalea sp.]
MNRNECNLGDYFEPIPLKGGFSMDGYWVWCGSVILGEDGNYHMFASRWKKDLPMHPGWGLASEIVRAVSKTPEGPYVFQEVVLTSRGAQYWDGRSVHNPHITKYKDEYILFYMGTTYPFDDVYPGEHIDVHNYRFISARSNKRIGIATSKSVFGPWERLDAPILNTRPDKFDNHLISNPAPCINEDGSCLLVYKARNYKNPPYNNGELHGLMALGVAYAPHYKGPYKPLTDKPLFDEKEHNVEDPFIWRNDKGYSMIAKDMHGNICGEKGAGVFASSVDGVNWSLKVGHKAFSRNLKWEDGKNRLMGNMDRPFLLFNGDEATHLFVATSDGTDSFMNAKNTYNLAIPLK